jgi:hypothetical protein
MSSTPGARGAQLSAPLTFSVAPDLLGVPCPLPPGKPTALPLGVRERLRELSEIDTIAAEFRRDRGGSSNTPERGDAPGRGEAAPSGG